ncbi:glycosyltransferase family 2 protein [Chryseobacterium sp.]|uniref:glycosyltransferase family 2 protein n=1 Tax=Chryseobacterium sp. TaxID=1871047 RepID=UPI00388D74CB
MISVIIPNYNHASFLIDRINSVLNQTYQDFELIILDDCSKDESISVIEGFRNHPKVSHVIYNKQNSGSPFQQWKKGIELASGEWIWLAESDDVAEPTFLETMIENIKKSDNVVLSYCASESIDAFGNKNGKNTWANSVSDRNWDNNFLNSGKTEIITQLFYKNTIPNASAVVFQKDAIDFSVFETIVKMKFTGDWMFWVSILQKGDVAYDHRLLNNFRYHDSSTRSWKSKEMELKRFEECLIVMRAIKERYKLQWDYRKHIWIIDEWIVKSQSFNQSRFKVFNKLFPISYNLVVFLKKIKQLSIRYL